MVEVPGGGSDPLAVIEKAERYIAAEAWNVDDSYAKAARIMQGLLDALAVLRGRLAETEARELEALTEKNDALNAQIKVEAELRALRVERDTAVDALREILDIDAVDWDAIGGKAFSIAERALAAVGGQTA